MRLNDFLLTAFDKLKQAGIDNPQLDARLLTGHILKMDRAQLLAQTERTLPLDEIARINELLQKRANGLSVARILGHREFWGLEFGLNEATLEPRPDSETLIEAALKQARSAKRILDLGTGTGCLLLSLLQEMPDATGLGIDINPRAVEKALENASALKLEKRATFRVGNWLQGISEKFDLIVSNPPYIPTKDIEGLMREVRDHDPRQALDGGLDGLDPYRHMIPQMGDFLTPKGMVAFEVGLGQADVLKKLFEKHGFQSIAAHKDLGGILRCVTAIKDGYKR